MKTFLDKYIEQREGEIVDLDGKVLGHHTGIHHYTIGQRKGLGIAAPEPLYVVKLDNVMNRVVVSTRDRAGQSECTVQRMNWLALPGITSPIRAEVQVRYRSGAVPVTVIPLEGDRLKLVFEEPQFGITPGQAAVLYDGDRVLGAALSNIPKRLSSIGRTFRGEGKPAVAVGPVQWLQTMLENSLRQTPGPVVLRSINSRKMSAL